MDLDMDLDLDLLGNYPHETIPNSSPPTLLRTDARYPVLTTSFLNKFDVTMNLDLLEKAARDGSMDYLQWPDQLEPLIQRIEQIVHDIFPLPQGSTAIQLPSSSQGTGSDPLSTSGRRPPVPPFPSTPPSESTESATGQSQSSPTPALQNDAGLPLAMQSLLTSILKTLRTNFSVKPPHTIQRLAELVLHPDTPYKTLPAYLRALDRIVSVTSTADIFPLPVSVPIPTDNMNNEVVNGLVNGHNGASSLTGLSTSAASSYLFTDNSLGSDESLGGALLTPIPWLSNNPLTIPQHELANEADGMADSSLELPDQYAHRPAGGVTQGELIRAEQEAGIVPSNQTMHPHNVAGRRAGTGPIGLVLGISADAGAEDAALDDGEIGKIGDNDEEVPHARGPDVLGVEDLGLQNGVGVELTLGRGQDRGGQSAGLLSVAGAESSGLGADAAATPETSADENSDAVMSEEDDTEVKDAPAREDLTMASGAGAGAQEAELQDSSPTASAAVTASPAAAPEVDADADADADGEADPDIDGDIILTDADGKDAESSTAIA